MIMEAQANFTADTPLWQLTVGQFTELVESKVKALLQQQQQPTQQAGQDKRYAHSIDELAAALGVSSVTAQSIKNSGAIDGAVSQWRRTLIIDIDLAIDLLRKSNRRHTAAKR